MVLEAGANGVSRRKRPSPGVSVGYGELQNMAAVVIGKAAEIQCTGASAPLANEWQGEFAAARAAIQPPMEQSQLIASFGLRTLVDRGTLVANQTTAERARSQTLAATVVELYAQKEMGSATALSSLVTEMSGDLSLPPLHSFFVCLEALVRCRLAKDTDAMVGVPAQAYWRIAVCEAEASVHPRLVLCAGLSGSGKSFVANGVACAIGARVIASDAERKRLAGLEPSQPTPPEMIKRVYNGQMTERVYHLLACEAEAELRSRRPVVLDATFLTSDRRMLPLRIAEALQVPAAIVWCSLSDAAARQRLSARAGEAWTISDADDRIRRLQRRGMKAPRRGQTRAALLELDTSVPPGVLFARLLPRLRDALISD